MLMALIVLLAIAAAVAVFNLVLGVSLRGWVVSHWIVPRLFPKQPGDRAALQDRIAADRAKGPARPNARQRRGRHFSDDRISGVRTFRLTPETMAPDGVTILYIHGGAYTFDLMDLQWTIAHGLIARTGAEVAAPLYPLAPESQVTAGLDAVERVYLTLVEASANKIVLLGDSAGGGLALALAHRLRDRDLPAPAALVLYFPWLDVTVSGPDQPDLERNDPILSIDSLRACGRMWAGNGDPAAPQSSPLFGDQANLPPTLVLTGTRDVLLSDTRRFAAVADAEIHEFAYMFHGWIAAPIPEARCALDRTASFIAVHTGRHPRPWP